MWYTDIQSTENPVFSRKETPCSETMEPVYTELPGWNQKITDTIPQKLEDYIKFIEDYIGVPVSFVSYGPDRTENFYRNK